MKTTTATDWREVHRRRAWELKSQGWKQRDIAAARGVTEGGVSPWLKQAQEHGAAGRAMRKASGRLPALCKNEIGCFGDSRIWRRGVLA